MPDQTKKQQFALLAIFLLVVFSYPILSIANKPTTIAGFPLLYAYIFSVWLTAILLLLFIAEKKGPKNKSGS